ncbi:TonB-dependent receptor [Pendulispora brunnea]|uniref:TonB-dependent receptor n=1 Tax=Pendulispora brunnea TaxID=2905690 RepID=A0ABZ2JZP2_9BACT
MSSTIAMVAPAQAQGTAVLTGKVVDASTKKGVADVVVTVTSPALQGEQIVTTDKTGSYRIPSLAPGVYTLHLDKEGFRAYQRDQIQLRADATIRLDADLLPEGLKAEEVVIVAHAPTVDVGSSTTGANINSDFTSRIPVTNPGSRGGAQRSFESIAEATPGAQADTYGTSVNGSTSPENSYFIDGVRTNSAKFGINGSPLSIEFIKEVNVLSGGYMPEYGRSTGGILNVVTKSGSNEYHGDVWANWTPGALEGKRKYPYFLGEAVQTRRSLANIWDVGFDQSGPIIKDKLWYYVGFGVSRAIYNLERSIYMSPIGDDGKPNYKVEGTEIPGTGSKYQATQTSYQIFGKLDFRVNQNNKLALTFAATPTTAGGGGDYSVNPTTGLVEGATVREFNLNGTYGAQARSYRSGAFDTSLKWTSEFDNKSKILDTTIGWHHELGGRRSADGFQVGSGLGYSAVPQVVYRRSPNLHGIEDFERAPGCSRVNGLPTCPVQTYTTGGSDLLDEQVFDIYSAKSVLTVLAEAAGHHVIKAGVDFELLTSWWSRGYSGGVRWRESTSGSRFDAQRGYGYESGPDQPIMLDRLTTRTYAINAGGFIQDSWQIFDKITLNAGIRYDNQFMIGSDNKLLMSLPNQISPRVGVIFDPTQKGRSKLFFNYARFYESVPLDMLDRQTGEGAIAQSVSSSKCDPRNPAQANGVCLTDTARINWPATGAGGPISSPDRKYSGVGGGKVVIDPDISPQSQSEIVAGAEYEVVKNGRFGLSYTRRWTNNIIEDMSNDEGATYFIGNPGKGIASGFPEATRNYDAGTAFFTKNFADQWLAQVSYTLSWLRGNSAGLYDPTTGQLDPNINATFDLKSLLVNQTGDLPGDRRHSFKIFGAKDISITKSSVVQIGGSVNVRSGGPTNFLGGNLLYGVDTIHILPRGTGDRLPWNGNVGTHLGYNVKFENGMTLGLTMDIFNLLNFQTELSRENRYTNQDVLPIPGGSRSDLDTPGKIRRQDGTAFDPSQKNPNFGNANIYQEPRQFRFGIRGSF